MAAMSYSEVMDFVEENDVKFIRLAFCDFFGNQKNVSIMPDELGRASKNGEPFCPLWISGYNDGTEEDLFLLPDFSTLCILPWRPQEGRVIRFYCDVVHADKTPWARDPRKLLKDTVEEFKKLGLRPRMSLFSEFYLFRTDEDGNPTTVPWDNGGYFDIAPFDRSENIRREICLTLEEMGLSPLASYHENGPGQNEIDFAEDSALHTADNFITYKNVVGAIAARNGLFASFAPKPIPDQSGNGLHVKVSLFQNGKNLRESDPAQAESFTAGVLARMRDITAFLNTQPDSYLRFGQNEAPKYITWSTKNASRLLRISEENGKQTGFILRSPDSGINPYLAFSVILSAGLAGVLRKEKLPEPVDKAGHCISMEERAKYKKLPQTLSEAAECAAESSFLREDPRLYEVVKRFLEILPEAK